MRFLPILILAFLIGSPVLNAKENKEKPQRPVSGQQLVPADDAVCATHTPFGQFTISGLRTFCKNPYTSYFDTNLKVPRVVSYDLTGDQSFGCLGRFQTFHPDGDLGPDERAIQHDYTNSGYDLGHMMPDQDAATDGTRLWDTYNTINVAPQLPKLNREGWESIEQIVRSSAWKRGSLIIYTGTIFAPGEAGETPKTIGNGVAIPNRFFKIVIDPKTSEALAFILNNEAIPKGDMSPYLVSIADVETATGFSFPLPAGIDKTKKAAMWEFDDSGWRKQHKVICHTS